jgi:hypothetical protein
VQPMKRPFLRDGVLRHDRWVGFPMDSRRGCQAGRTIPDLEDLGAGSQAMPGPPRVDPPGQGTATSGPGAQYRQGESCHDRILFALKPLLSSNDVMIAWVTSSAKKTGENSSTPFKHSTWHAGLDGNQRCLVGSWVHSRYCALTSGISGHSAGGSGQASASTRRSALSFQGARRNGNGPSDCPQLDRRCAFLYSHWLAGVRSAPETAAWKSW